MATRGALQLKQDWAAMPAEMFEFLTFGELKEGDAFIDMPLPGDNDGHGGLRGEYHIFTKVRGTPDESYHYGEKDNSVCLKTGSFSTMTPGMRVIKVK